MAQLAAAMAFIQAAGAVIAVGVGGIAGAVDGAAAFVGVVVVAAAVVAVLQLSRVSVNNKIRMDCASMKK